VSTQERWTEGKTDRKSVSSVETVKKVLDIIREFNKVGVYPTTREVSNVYYGKSSEDTEFPTEVQDGLLQGILNPLERQGKLMSKYWKRNQKIWRIPEKPTDVSPKKK